VEAIEFSHFMETYGKQYGPEEYRHRLTIFKDNMEKVRLLQKTEQGTAVYGTTLFADLTGRFRFLQKQVSNKFTIS